ncbi:hypothetical protein Tco_0313730 [Tanacetum coccineum]
MARIQQAKTDSDERPSNESAFISEVQTPSTSFMNPLFSKSNHEQTYHEQPKIINFTNGDDQIISEIIFDDPNIEVNDGSVEHDKSAHDSYDNELEQLARNVYKEAEKQHILAKKLYATSYLYTSKVHVNVCDTEEILKDATKSQIKIENTLKDPIVIEKKQNFRPIDYGKLNDLYKTFVPQVELSLEQNCCSSASTSSETPTSASTSSSPPLTMPSSSELIRHLDMLEDEIKKLYTLLETTTTLKSIFFTSYEDKILNEFCYK